MWQHNVNRPFALLFGSYTLEGVGYIIAGTFLVAAVAQHSPGWLGNGAWLVVGLAAIPSAALLGAILFGGTFIGVSTLALAAGRLLQFPSTVAFLTAGDSAGQIIGPVAVSPLLRHGFEPALIVGSLAVAERAPGDTSVVGGRGVHRGRDLPGAAPVQRRAPGRLRLLRIPAGRAQ
jgi:hypothetical protein